MKLEFALVLSTLLALTTYAKECSCNNIPSRINPHSTQAENQSSDMVKIPAGTFLMGGDGNQAKNDELPKHSVTLNGFWMDKTEVTNAQFQIFVTATNYVTTAEKKPDWESLKRQLPPDTPQPDEKMLVAASLVFHQTDHPVPLNNFTQWWFWTVGANWLHPRGPASKIEGLDHPVVHVSWDDANAYCQWQEKRLPTEAEWEWAARGGLANQVYPWGHELIDKGAVKANTWQGQFPYKNKTRDNYFYTSPVAQFVPNGYGLYDMAGNVWEWVSDWYRVDYYSTVKEGSNNPQGPVSSFDPEEPYSPKRVLRGGSFLCNETFCSGYRVSARMKSSPDTGMQHMGFRCVKEL